jgi:hypothetical protein
MMPPRATHRSSHGTEGGKRTRAAAVDAAPALLPGLVLGLLCAALAEIPLAPGVKGNSIIAFQGDGDFRQGKDGLVSYDSAHVDYVESEYIVRSFHSCQDKPPTIEEVRRILHKHLATLPEPQPPVSIPAR